MKRYRYVICKYYLRIDLFARFSGLKESLVSFLILLTVLRGAKAAEFQGLGPIAKSAFAGLSRLEGSYLPNSTAPFFSVNIDGACSPTYITNDGYFLLSLHCIIFCLRYGPDSFIPSGVLSSENILGIDVTRIDAAKAKKLYCPIRGATQEKKSGLRASVVSIGAPGFIYGEQYYQLSKNPELFAKLNALGFNGIGGSGDFALMKMEYQPTAETALTEYVSAPGECLPVSTEKAPLNTKVWSVTHPNLYRPNLKSAYRPLVSAGKVVSTHNNLQLTSVDADGGSSGGSYFDSQGRIAGIVIATSNPHSSYTYGSTLGIDISHILAYLKKDLSEDTYKKVISGCNMTPLTKSLIQEVTAVSDDDK